MTSHEFEEFIAKQQFITARTAKRNPHEYIVRHKTVVGTDEEFEQAVIFIRENGFKINFWKRQYIVYHLNGRLYWTMGSPLEETTILNRNNLNDYILTLRSRHE